MALSLSATLLNNVDLPTPGSPPIRISEPGTAGHSVELFHAGCLSRFVLGFGLGELDWFASGQTEPAAGRRGAFFRRGGFGPFDESVPPAAVGTFAEPFARLEAATLAGV